MEPDVREVGGMRVMVTHSFVSYREAISAALNRPQKTEAALGEVFTT